MKVRYVKMKIGVLILLLCHPTFFTVAISSRQAAFFFLISLGDAGSQEPHHMIPSRSDMELVSHHWVNPRKILLCQDFKCLRNFKFVVGLRSILPRPQE